MKARLMLLMLLVGLMIPAVRARAAEAGNSPQRIEILARRFAYSPGEITLKKGQTVVLVLKSVDVAHGLRFRDFGINIQAKAGGKVEVEFTPDKTGDFIGHCSVFCGSGHGSMEITLHVVA